MATVITVHGTFAHADAAASEAPASSQLQWWQSGSAFETDIRKQVTAETGKLDIVPFVWSGENSEVARRDAGARLARRLRDLEGKGEPYCIIGHSHGGSVVASALLESAARKQPLQNLQRWITIGAPFINLRKERWLLTRLSLMNKVILVASFMLFLMFAVYMAASYLTGERAIIGNAFPRIIMVAGLMTSVPALLVYIVLRVIDGRRLLAYRSGVTDRARASFAGKWLSLAHPDDEAIQGLSLLPDAKLMFFDRSFAVPTLTLMSVIALPILYFAILLSPTTMVGFAEWLKTDIYESRSSPEAETALIGLRDELIAMRRDGDADATAPGADQSRPREERRAARAAYRQKRDALELQYPNLDAIERGLRFKQRFFQKDRQPCVGGTLCGGGRDLTVNSALLLHVVTDEVSWALGADQIEDRRQRWFWSLFVPGVLVPLVFGLVALALMLIIQGVAVAISRLLSGSLNAVTNAEVKRAAFGNDTDGELAVGAADRPSWIAKSPPRLPPALADLVTDYSNGVASQSLAKFRRAIGQIASADPRHTADAAITTYFTWKELVHGSYFDVPEFRKLIANAIGRSPGFQASDTLTSDKDYERVGGWLAEIERSPGVEVTTKNASQTTGAADAKAVAAVVASTVKGQP